jgi:hypothetical protein
VNFILFVSNNIKNSKKHADKSMSDGGRQQYQKWQDFYDGEFLTDDGWGGADENSVVL